MDNNKKALLLNILFLLILGTHQLNEANQMCYEACMKSCHLASNIPQNRCPALCRAHCLAYSGEQQRNSVRQVECSLLCRYADIMSLDKCDKSCTGDRADQVTRELNDFLSKQPYKTDDDDAGGRDEETNDGKKKQDPGCEGNGSEYCYKECRLIEKETVEKCKCACCPTKNMSCDDNDNHRRLRPRLY